MCVFVGKCLCVRLIENVCVFVCLFGFVGGCFIVFVCVCVCLCFCEDLFLWAVCVCVCIGVKFCTCVFE